MPLNKLIQPGDNPDLTEERKIGTFDTDALAAVIKGGIKKLNRSRALKAEIARRPEFQDTRPIGHMSRDEKVENATRKTVHLFQEMANGEICNPTDPFEIGTMANEIFGAEGMPLGLHWIMFIPTLQNQCDEEQTEWWLFKALKGEILGTYAQTEMGHGTNLAKVETTATYDKATEEFVIHSPTVTSMKWWPGGLGNTVNHVVLVAQLITNGKNYGNHIFLVQVRDMDTHRPPPGVRVGDIGDKMGVKGVDNGFLVFDHYRIPRRNMLMQYAKVDKDGTYHPPLHAKMTYSTMIFTRAEIVLMQATNLMIAATIATRYSCVRRQGEIIPGDGEVKLLDYQTQQNRIFPAIAKTFAFHFAAEEVREMAADIIGDMKNGKINSEALADAHAMSCCLKGFTTFETNNCIEQCRMACGGHGYSEASGLPTLYACSVAACTYEGDNLVMFLQTAKYLMKAVQASKEGKELGPSVEFLREKGAKTSLVDRIPAGDYSHYLQDFEHVARKQILNAYDRLEEIKKKGTNPDVAWSLNGIEATKASRTYARLIIARLFFRSVQHIANYQIKEILEDLFHLHLNLDLLAQSKYLLQDGYMSPHQLNHIKEDVYRLYAKIRPNAVSIVDSFDCSDRELRSVLGRRDGHVYENLYEWAQHSTLNQHPDVINPVFEKYLKPLMRGEQSKL